MPPQAEKPQQLFDQVKAILASDSATEVLMKFLVKEFSSENLKFLLAVKKYKAKPTGRIGFKKIYDEFIADSSLTQVNLPSGLFRKMEAILVGNELVDWSKAFDEAETEVIWLIARDSYQRFRRTAEGKTALETLNGKPKPSRLHAARDLFSKLCRSFDEIASSGSG